MQRIATWRRHFNWRMLLMRTVVNGLVLLVTVIVIPRVSFVDHRIGTLLLLAVVLGVLNAFVKPIIAFATLRFIFATYGVVVAVINAAILWLLALLLPGYLAVDSLLWVLVAGALIGMLSSVMESLLGITPPIVSEKYPEVREMINERDTHRVEEYVARAETRKRQQEQEAADQEEGDEAAADAAAILAVVGAAPDSEGNAKATPTTADSGVAVNDEREANDKPTTDEQEA